MAASDEGATIEVATMALVCHAGLSMTGTKEDMVGPMAITLRRPLLMCLHHQEPLDSGSVYHHRPHQLIITTTSCTTTAMAVLQAITTNTEAHRNHLTVLLVIRGTEDNPMIEDEAQEDTAQEAMVLEVTTEMGGHTGSLWN